MPSTELQRMLSDVRRRLEALYAERLEALVLFGSQARGDARPGSDVDLLVVLHGDVDPGIEIERTGEVLAELSLSYGVVLSCTFISAARYRTEQSPLLLNVRREGRAA